jgi:pimeloyl-ACP methyl ester carboxylesterase
LVLRNFSKASASEWSYFWLGAQRAKLAKGTVVNGEQMYVEYFVPANVRHPFSIVLVHGGGGQGLDWLTTPDGRPGWVHHLAMEGYRVYVVDRPGHGRSPYHPDLHGPFGARASAYAGVSDRFTAPEKSEMPYGPQAKLHNQWPGTGLLGDPFMDQAVAGQGGSFIGDLAATHAIWAQRAGELLDKIGPAVIMSHSMGGPFAFIAANARPNLVVGLLPVEPNGPPFGNLAWGVTASAMEYDPPVSSASDLKTVEVKPTESNRDPYLIQAEPARKLKNLIGIPIAVLTAEASYHVPYDYGTVAFLRQSGCTVEHINLWEHGVRGNSHFFMMEKNNREALQPLLNFLDKTVTPAAARKVQAARSRPARRPPESTAMKLADTGNFWVGVERKTMPYGTIAAGQMYVQYLVPEQVRHPNAIVLVHGGGGQMLDYMGKGDGEAGWAHYYVQAGYRVYLVDRPGHGRVQYHPDALGPIGPQPTYEQLLPLFRGTVSGSSKWWPGTADIGDPLLDQFMAGQNAAPQDQAAMARAWARGGAELLDKIGPAVIQTHSAGGPFVATPPGEHRAGRSAPWHDDRSHRAAAADFAWPTSRKTGAARHRDREYWPSRHRTIRSAAALADRIASPPRSRTDWAKLPANK